MPYRYLFGPVSAPFVANHLARAQQAGECLAFNAAGAKSCRHQAVRIAQAGRKNGKGDGARIWRTRTVDHRGTRERIDTHSLERLIGTGQAGK